MKPNPVSDLPVRHNKRRARVKTTGSKTTQRASERKPATEDLSERERLAAGLCRAFRSLLSASLLLLKEKRCCCCCCCYCSVPLLFLYSSLPPSLPPPAPSFLLPPPPPSSAAAAVERRPTTLLLLLLFLSLSLALSCFFSSISSAGLTGPGRVAIGQAGADRRRHPCSLLHVRSPAFIRPLPSSFHLLLISECSHSYDHPGTD